MKEEFIKRLKEADTDKEYWFDSLMDTLPKCYAKGYIEAKDGEHNSNGGEYNEYYKAQIKEWCSWFSWV